MITAKRTILAFVRSPFNDHSRNVWHNNVVAADVALVRLVGVVRVREMFGQSRSMAQCYAAELSVKITAMYPKRRDP